MHPCTKTLCPASHLYGSFFSLLVKKYWHPAMLIEQGNLWGKLLVTSLLQSAPNFGDRLRKFSWLIASPSPVLIIKHRPYCWGGQRFVTQNKWFCVGEHSIQNLLTLQFLGSKLYDSDFSSYCYQYGSGESHIQFMEFIGAVQGLLWGSSVSSLCVIIILDW